MWPRIAHVEDDRISVVDGVTVVFFLDATHQECADEVAFAIDQIVSFAGETALRYYVDEEGDALPLSVGLYHSLIGQLRQSKAAGEGGISLIGDDVNVTATDVYYFGEAEPSESRPNWRNVLRFHVSSTLFTTQGAGRFGAFFRSLTRSLPFSFAYASPCLCYRHDMVSAARIARRYPGFDILNPGAAATSIDDKLAGIYWLSFLGQKTVASLGGFAHLQGQLDGLAKVTLLKEGKVEIQIGDEPRVGDVNRKDILPEYRAVAEKLEPHLQLPEIVYFREDDGITPDKESMIAWHRRFLD